MRFQIPQFIEVESKIFGPLTLKQFIFLAGGAGIIFVLYTILPFFLTVLLGIPIASLVVGLAFYKINNQPFIKVLENGFRHLTSAKVYVWNRAKEEKKKKISQKEKNASSQESQLYMPTLTENKLKDLAWQLNIKTKIK